MPGQGQMSGQEARSGPQLLLQPCCSWHPAVVLASWHRLLCCSDTSLAGGELTSFWIHGLELALQPPQEDGAVLGMGTPLLHRR